MSTAFFHLYGLNRAAACILDTFPFIGRKNKAAHGIHAIGPLAFRSETRRMAEVICFTISL